MNLGRVLWKKCNTFCEFCKPVQQQILIHIWIELTVRIEEKKSFAHFYAIKRAAKPLLEKNLLKNCSIGAK